MKSRLSPEAMFAERVCGGAEMKDEAIDADGSGGRWTKPEKQNNIKIT